MNAIENIFKDAAIFRSGVMLLSKRDAIQFIRECEKANVRILGVDGFLVVGNKMQSSLETSIDFTVPYAITENIIEQSINFVNSFDEEFLFEVVCE